MIGKIILALGSIVVCSAFGMGKSAAITRRAKELDAVLLMIQKMQSCLQYEKMTTIELLQMMAESSALEELSFLGHCVQEMKCGNAFPIAWKSALDLGHEQSYLEAEDIQTLGLIGGVLGGADAQSQIGELSVIASLLEQCRDKAKEAQEEKGKLYRSLGVLSGLGIAVLII